MSTVDTQLLVKKVIVISNCPIKRATRSTVVVKEQRQHDETLAINENVVWLIPPLGSVQRILTQPYRCDGKFMKIKGSKAHNLACPNQTFKCLHHGK